MPGRDKTGPMGQGPKSGRQMGNCPGAKPQPSGFFSRRGGKADPGRGIGRGFGQAQASDNE